MSGPTTRSHRSSVRGAETTLAEISDLLKANKSVVMITGAGLSAASGIPTFRGGNDSLWCVTAAAQGRRSVFLRDPLRWYNEFWLRHFPMSFTRKIPNAGHEAVAALASRFPELRVVTQNIDGLHQETMNAWPDPSRLIEVHGRLGLFKCVADDDEDECPYSYEKALKPSVFPENVRTALEDDAHATAGVGLSLTEIPRCPHCGEASPPMSLLFDEDYDSHSFYDFERVEEWFKGADAIVFVGTSFAVTLTSLAIREAKRRSIPVFDFNLAVSLKASPSLNAKTVLGPAEVTLPTLVRLAGASIATVVDDTSSSNLGSSPTSDEDDGNSSLGRRSREASLEGDPDALPEGGVAKMARGLGSSAGRGDSPGGPAGPGGRAGAGSVTSRAWGGGAKFLLQPALETPLRKDQVRVDLSESYSRKVHPDQQVEANVEVLWQEQLAKNPLLFNASKFRLAGYSTEGDHTVTATGAADTAAAAAPAAAAAETLAKADTSLGEDGTRTPPPPPPRSRSPSSPPTRRLRLHLGLTDYRTFRGTNWSPEAARLAADGVRDLPWLEGAYLSQKLGVGAIVETCDGFVLSLRRSMGVAEGQGMMGAPGGHPEPEKLGLTAEVLRGLAGKQASSRRRLGQLVTEELFDSAVQEVVDETNVPRLALGEPLLSGLVRQGNSFGAPTAAFVIPCSLERAQAAKLYAQGAKEGFESTSLHAIPGAEIIEEGVRAWFSNRGLQATPSFQGALELWRAHRVQEMV